MHHLWVWHKWHVYVRVQLVLLEVIAGSTLGCVRRNKPGVLRWFRSPFDQKRRLLVCFVQRYHVPLRLTRVPLASFAVDGLYCDHGYLLLLVLL